MIPAMQPLYSLASTSSLVLLLSLAACGDKSATDTDETGTGETATETAADDVGESGTATATTTSTSTDTGTTDTGCTIGSEGCPCTDGGGCDPGLVCDAGTCGPPAGTDTGTTDTGTTTDTGATDTTGGDPLPYQACPGGDADCAPGEICVTGTANQGQLPWTMCTSGTCNGDDECTVDDNDFCNDLPGDGEPIDYCVPLFCDDQNPCPDPMQCAAGFGGGTSVCVWPD